MEIFREEGERVIASLSDIAPDPEDLSRRVCLWEVFTRPGLDGANPGNGIDRASRNGVPLQDWGGLGGTNSFTSKFMMKGDPHPSIRVESP